MKIDIVIVHVHHLYKETCSAGLAKNRACFGITWVDGELWQATWEGEESDIRRVDPRTGEVQERLEMPAGVYVSGLESDVRDQLFCGGGPSGRVWAVRRGLGELRRGQATLKARWAQKKLVAAPTDHAFLGVRISF